MEPTEYYIKTLTAAFKNIAPLVAFIVGGYFIFVKMPFLFFRKSMDEQKKKLQDENKDVTVKAEKYTVEDYKKFQETVKLLNAKEQPKQEQPKQEQPKQEQKKKEEPKRERPAPKPSSSVKSPEEVFNLKPGEAISQSELKKRYIELIKQNHPDRVASMGQDFKKLAENNTKEINKAFEALKKKAS